MNRRHFLKQFGALAAAGFILPEAAKANGYQVIIPAQGVVPAAPVNPHPPGAGFTQSYFDLSRTPNYSNAYGFAPVLGVFVGSFSADINLGQKPFVGNPGGFEPFDPSFSGKFVSNGSVCTQSGSVVTIGGRDALYTKSKFSGKYYFEATNVFSGSVSQFYSELGVACAPLNFSMAATRITSSYQALWAGSYSNPNQGFVNNLNGNSLPWSYNTGSAATQWTQGSTVGVWVDIDNKLMTVMKIGTTRSDYGYTVGYPPPGAV